MRHTFTDVGRKRVHAYVIDPPTGPTAASVVLVPGLACRSTPSRPRTTIIGHSTGSQATLTAALSAQERHPNLSVVLAGPTFTPAQRRWPHLARAVVTA